MPVEREKRRNPYSIERLKITPGHSGLEGNKKADLAAKSRAEKGGRQAERWSSIAYIKDKPSSRTVQRDS